MELTWYGTANIVLRDEKTGERIVFDPFVGHPIGKRRQEELLSSMKDIFSSIPHVFITHGHFDHISHIPYFYQGTSAIIYGTKTPCRTLKKRGIPEEMLRTIAPGWSGQAGPFTVRAWQSRHCKFDAPLIISTLLRPGLWCHLAHLFRMIAKVLTSPEGGEILFYEVNDARVRVQIMGSLNLEPKTDYPIGADYLILPLQGRSDLVPYGMRIVERLKPKAVLLDHCDDSFPPLSDDIHTEEFERVIEQRIGIPCQSLKKGESVRL